MKNAQTISTHLQVHHKPKQTIETPAHYGAHAQCLFSSCSRSLRGGDS